MNKILLAGLTIAMLIFSGCSQKNPDVDMTNENAKSSYNRFADSRPKNTGVGSIIISFFDFGFGIQ